MSIRLIHHLVVVCDETGHVSGKRIVEHAAKLRAGYLETFPEGGRVQESPALIATGSPIFPLGRVSSFLHEGTFVEHAGKNKDLAIAKYCWLGLIDQDERSHFVLDDVRAERFAKGDPPMHADGAALVALVTSDFGAGMREAVDYAMNKARGRRTNFATLQVDHKMVSGHDRMRVAGNLLGQSLRPLFVRSEAGGMLLDLE